MNYLNKPFSGHNRHERHRTHEKERCQKTHISGYGVSNGKAGFIHDLKRLTVFVLLFLPKSLFRINIDILWTIESTFLQDNIHFICLFFSQTHFKRSYCIKSEKRARERKQLIFADDRKTSFKWISSLDKMKTCNNTILYEAQLPFEETNSSFYAWSIRVNRNQTSKPNNVEFRYNDNSRYNDIETRL